LLTENLKFGAEHLKSLNSLDAVVEISDMKTLPSLTTH
jgi:hypothetical protein